MIVLRKSRAVEGNTAPPATLNESKQTLMFGKIHLSHSVSVTRISNIFSPNEVDGSNIAPPAVALVISIEGYALALYGLSVLRDFGTGTESHRDC